MSAPESFQNQGLASLYRSLYEDDDLPRGVKAYGETKIVDGIRMSGIVEGLRLAQGIYARVGDKIEKIGVDPEPLEDEYLTLEDIPGILTELSAEDKLSN
ncbi:hypothetical protein KW801_02955 [Candidatus Saccharibacteria bacterium]|nr:hypothetical protein [Candidatus Saccharibacteria bacterium]